MLDLWKAQQRLRLEMQKYTDIHWHRDNSLEPSWEDFIEDKQSNGPPTWLTGFTIEQ